MVISPNTIFFRHTNEWRNFALTTHNNESSLFAALNLWFAFGAVRLVVFRLVGCLRRNGLAACWDGSVLLLDLWGMCWKSPCSFVSGIWRRVCVSPLMWARGEMVASVSRAELRSNRHSQFLGWHEVVPVEGMLNVSNLCSTGIPRKESIN